MNRRNITSGAPWERKVGYSRALRVGRQVFVSGTTAVGPDGQVVGPGDAHAQSMRILEIIEAALKEAGASMADVVRTRIYVTRIGDWQAVGRAHGAYFHEVKPASTMVEVSALIDPAMLVEIEAEAIVSSED